MTRPSKLPVAINKYTFIGPPRHDDLILERMSVATAAPGSGTSITHNIALHPGGAITLQSGGSPPRRAKGGRRWGSVHRPPVSLQALHTSATSDTVSPAPQQPLPVTHQSEVSHQTLSSTLPSPRRAPSKSPNLARRQKVVKN